jgi:hypothetical protein
MALMMTTLVVLIIRIGVTLLLPWRVMVVCVDSEDMYFGSSSNIADLSYCQWG